MRTTALFLIPSVLSLAACAGGEISNEMCIAQARVSEHELAHALEEIDETGRAVITVHEPSRGAGEEPVHGMVDGDRARTTLFLNRAGGQYVHGPSDSARNVSSIVEEGCAVVPAFPYADAVWRDTVSCVEDLFARYDVVVTDEEPSSGRYIEAVVGGKPQDLGLPRGVAGIAPMDAEECGVLSKAVVFVFAENLPESGQLLCEVAAQEIAHALGLDHQYLCEDPMTYLRGCGAKSFQNVDALCGEGKIRDCMCGRPYQNSVHLLAEILGTKDGRPPEPARQDEEAPTIEVLSPEDGEALEAHSYVQIVAEAQDDVSVSRVELHWEHTGDVVPCPYRGSQARCERVGTTYSWRLRVGEGERAFRLKAQDHVGNVATTPTHRLVFEPIPGGVAAATGADGL